MALATVPLRRQARKATHPVSHHSTLASVRLQPSLWRHFFALPGLSLLDGRLPPSPGDGVLLLLGAGAFFILAAASGSTLRMMRRMGPGLRGR